MFGWLHRFMGYMNAVENSAIHQKCFESPGEFSNSRSIPSKLLRKRSPEKDD
jgi:hypothetical protein